MLVLDFELLDSIDLAKLGFIDLLLFDGLYGVFILASQDVVEDRLESIFVPFFVVLDLPFGQLELLDDLAIVGLSLIVFDELHVKSVLLKSFCMEIVYVLL